MRETMRESLKKYSQFAKTGEGYLLPVDPHEKGEDVTEMEDVETYIHKRAEESKTRIETQEKIFSIQKEKQKIMRELEAQLKKISSQKRDFKEWKPLEDSRPIVFRDNTLLWRQRIRRNFVEHPITLGEILTDMSWGILYDLDPQTAPKDLQKRVAIEKAKQQLAYLLDEQLYLRVNDYKKEKTFVPAHRERQRYFTFLRLEKGGGPDAFANGVIAEQLVANFFRKLEIDDSLPIRMTEGNLYQDMIEGIDFIVQRVSWKRGVRVQAEQNERIGIQFTVSRDETILAKKRRKMERDPKKTTAKLQDMALVSYPLRTLFENWNIWNECGRPPGGPEQYLPLKTQEELFKTLLQKLFSEEELRQHWDRIQKKKLEHLQESLGVSLGSSLLEALETWRTPQGENLLQAFKKFVVSRNRPVRNEREALGVLNIFLSQQDFPYVENLNPDRENFPPQLREVLLRARRENLPTAIQNQQVAQILFRPLSAVPRPKEETTLQPLAEAA